METVETEIPLGLYFEKGLILRQDFPFPEYVQYLDPPTSEMEKVFTAQELMMGADAFINFRGVRASGKSTWVSRLVDFFPRNVTYMPMVMTRPLRPIEIASGRYDYICMTVEEFNRTRKAKEFLFTFLLWDLKTAESGELIWRATRAGILIDTMKEVINTGKKILSILSPGPDYELYRHLFPGMRTVLIEASDEDYDLYLKSRGEDKAFAALAMVNRHRAIYDESTFPPQTEIVVNARWRITRNSPEMARMKDLILRFPMHHLSPERPRRCDK